MPLVARRRLPSVPPLSNENTASCPDATRVIVLRAPAGNQRGELLQPFEILAARLDRDQVAQRVEQRLLLLAGEVMDGGHRGGLQKAAGQQAENGGEQRGPWATRVGEGGWHEGRDESSRRNGRPRASRSGGWLRRDGPVAAAMPRRRRSPIIPTQAGPWGDTAVGDADGGPVRGEAAEGESVETIDGAARGSSWNRHAARI